MPVYKRCINKNNHCYKPLLFSILPFKDRNNKETCLKAIEYSLVNYRNISSRLKGDLNVINKLLEKSKGLYYNLIPIEFVINNNNNDINIDIAFMILNYIKDNNNIPNLIKRCNNYNLFHKIIRRQQFLTNFKAYEIELFLSKLPNLNYIIYLLNDLPTEIILYIMTFIPIKYILKMNYY